MLKQEQQIQQVQDPLANIFEEGVDDFTFYKKQRNEDFVSRNQKHKQKIQRLEHDINDPALRKKRNDARRQHQKKKLNEMMNKMTPEEVKVFILERKRKWEEGRKKVRDAMKTGQVFMVDLNFQNRMNGKQNKSLAKQLQLITQCIKNLDHPPSVHFCSFQGGIQTQLERMGYQYWPATVHKENIVQIGKLLGKKLIYLSPDAQLALDHVDQNCAYILGGLIDRTIIKYASVFRARDLGIQVRKLPIKAFMKSRICLNLDHVVMMVCKFKETGDWKTAFDFAAPKRWKRQQEDQKSESSSEGSNYEDENKNSNEKQTFNQNNQEEKEEKTVQKQQKTQNLKV